MGIFLVRKSIIRSAYYLRVLADLIFNMFDLNSPQIRPLFYDGKPSSDLTTALITTPGWYIIETYKLLHRKCNALIFIHELQNFGNERVSAANEYVCLRFARSE